MIRFTEVSPGHFTVNHHGLHGVVCVLGHKATWSVMARPHDTAKWNAANSVKAAKRAVSEVMRKGRDWKERAKATTEELQEAFSHLAEAVEKGGSAQAIYLKCNTMRRIWVELDRRGANVKWPDDEDTRYFLTI